MKTFGSIRCRVVSVAAVTVLLYMVCPQLLSAQDRIYFRDKSSVEAVVLEINEEDVLYKAFDNQNGPQYRVGIDKVSRIVFSNGKEQVFDRRPWNDDIFSSYAAVPGLMDYRFGHYYIGMTRITSEDLIDYIGYTNFGSRYIRAKRQFTAGFTLTCAGAGLVLGGALLHISSSAGPSSVGTGGFSDMAAGYDDAESAIYTAFYVLGAASLGTGIPLLVSGNRKLSQIADEYNSRYGYSSLGEKRNSLVLGACRSGGVGFAFNF